MRFSHLSGWRTYKVIDNQSEKIVTSLCRAQNIVFQTYVSNLLNDIYVRRFNSLDLVTFEEADYVDYRRKIRIVGASCKYGVYRCHESTRSLRKEWSTEKLIKLVPGLTFYFQSAREIHVQVKNHFFRNKSFWRLKTLYFRGYS